MNLLTEKLLLFFNKQKKNLKLSNLVLHEPSITNIENSYVTRCLESGYVSTIGKYVNLFENKLKKFTKSKYIISTASGTAALHIALKLIGIKKDEEVLIPTISFVATANSILYESAIPHFVDVEEDNFGIDPAKLDRYLKENSIIKKNACFNKKTQKKISAIIVVHVFGHTAKIEQIIKIAKKYKLKVIEDAAESLGSFFKSQHLGTFGDVGILSFNGNKIITTGGGGAILTKSKYLATRALKLTTTSKIKHKWEYIHDELGYNYRMPNLNSALGLAQLGKIHTFLRLKKKLFKKYSLILKNINDVKLVSQPKFSKSNFWLQTIVIKKNSKKIRDKFLLKMHKNKIFARPVWSLLHKQKHLKKYPKMNLSTAESLKYRIINLPSSPYLGN